MGDFWGPLGKCVLESWASFMGFSRYFVVRRCRGATAEPPRRSGRAGPSPPRPGPSLDLGIWKSGDLEIQKIGIQKMKNIKNIKIQIRSAQNVGKVWISRKKNLLAPFGAIPGHFLRGPEKCKKCYVFCYFPWLPWLQVMADLMRGLFLLCLLYTSPSPRD